MAGFFGVMHLKSDVTSLARERLQLVKEQHRLREDVRVLKAEYAHLTSPDRLWALATQRGYGELQVQQLAHMQAPLPVTAHMVAWRP